MFFLKIIFSPIDFEMDENDDFFKRFFGGSFRDKKDSNFNDINSFFANDMRQFDQMFTEMDKIMRGLSFGNFGRDFNVPMIGISDQENTNKNNAN